MNCLILFENILSTRQGRQMKFLLIPSQNGFGHVTRLIQIGRELIQKKYQVTLILSKRQKNLLPKHFDTSENFRIFDLPSFEIDGYENTKKLNRINKSQVKLVADADVVIADNVLWPAKFNSNFYLHGHFLWSSVLNDLDPKVLAEEIKRLDNVKKWFQIKHFSLSSNYLENLNKVIKVNVMRYQNDEKIRVLPIARKTIWLASGSIDAHKKLIRQIKNFDKNFEFKYIETHAMLNLGYRPEFVIGRPGLTTIRDCLSAGIQFIPLKINMDKELESNIEYLIKLGLVSRDAYEDFSLNFNLNHLTKFIIQSKFIEDLWCKISEDAKVVTCTILDNI